MTVSREESLVRLKAGEPFDLLVIGGGATGCGVALDAASRGLRTALLEKGDFAEGTSGRSTKLLHGGVRYLESAVKHLDPVQYRLVRDGLRERGVLLRIAPHLCHRIALVTPLYHWLEVPYILTGLKIYDLLAGNMGIGHSRLLSHAHALKRFPMLKERGLKAAVLYYDGQFNDARMAVLIALTAARLGAVVANHVAAAGFHREGGRISGVVARDSLTGEEWIVPARVVVNATGPFTDTIRVLDDPDVAPMLTVSSGIHMVLDKRFSPPDTGLLIPRTRDNRVLFILPWEGHAIIGTTDEPAQLSEHPRPTEEEVQYLTRYIGEYFDLDFSSRDIKATWSGLRPLLHDPKASDTARLSRDHIVAESPSGLVTVTGGKWTTYRLMAEHTVDYVVRRFGLTPRVGCRTRTLPIAGAEGFDPRGADTLAVRFDLQPEVARHLNLAYGGDAEKVAALAAAGHGRRLDEDHPFVEAEVIYAARHEMAWCAMDVLARRTVLALLDTAAARGAAGRVIELMAAELGWDPGRVRQEQEEVEKRLSTSL